MSVPGPSVAWFERVFAQVIGRFRTLEIEPLVRRLDAIERKQNFEQRLARLEAGMANNETVIDIGELRQASRRGGR